MRITFQKAWNDLLAGGNRSLLTVLALALGVWGLGSVAVSARILGPDLRANFSGTAPPHAIVTLDHSAPSAWAGVVTEARDLAILRIEVRPDEWIPLWLFGVDNFSHQDIAKVRPESGSRIPPAGTMVIERDGLLISDLHTGSRARIRTGGQQQEVVVSGIVFDPAQAPATQDHFIYAYADRQTWSQLTGKESGTRVLVRVPGATSKADVERAVARLPGSVAVPEFEMHPHQWQLDLLMGIIGSVGFLSFLLSSVMVGQVVSAQFHRQVRQIGILKAVGASRRRIVALYAVFLSIVAVAGGLISVPLAIATGQGFAAFVGKTINFEILTTGVPIDTWVLLVGSAAVLPFLFAAPTVLRAGRIPVREALADASVAATKLTRGPWAFRNLARRPGRNLVVAGTMALGVAIFSTGFNVRESLAQFLESTRDAMRFDLQVVLSEPVSADALAPLSQLPGVAQTELWSGGRGELQSQVAGLSAEGVGVVSLPWNTTMAAPRLLSGRWLQSPDAAEVLLNQVAARTLGLSHGEGQVTLRAGGKDRTARVVGIVEEIDKGKVYLSSELWAAWANPENKANTLTIVSADRSYQGVMALKKTLEKAVSASDLKVLYVISQAERTKIIADHLDIILTVILLLSFLVLGVAALGMAAASSITVLERTREIGVLRAIGAGPRRIVGMFVAEGVLLAAAAVVTGLLLSLPLSGAASAFFGSLMLGEGAVLRFAWSPLGTLVTATVTLGFGWWAALAPARGATRVSTRRALAYE